MTPITTVCRRPWAGEVLGLAIQKANAVDQEKVLSALHQLDIMTVGGPFKAGGDGSNQGAAMSLGQIQNGNFLAVWPDISLRRSRSTGQ